MIEFLSHSQLCERPKRAHQIFSQRYEVFVRRLHWQVPSRGFYEFDQYDRDGAAYILSLDDRERLCGCCRVLPTSNAYMLSEVFISLWGNESPLHSTKIMELSRFCVDAAGDTAASAGENCSVTTELFAGMVDYVLRIGTEQVVAVITLPVLRIIRRLIHSDPEWRGPISKLDGLKSVAIRFRVTDSMLAQLCADLGTSLTYSASTAMPSVKRAA